MSLAYGRVNTMKKIRKSYLKWMGVKRRIHNSGIIRTIEEGEIWWAAVGENVGVEIDGKNEKYSRPVLVQTKPMDVTRLYQKMGELSKGDYRGVLHAYLELFEKNMP